MVGASTSWGCSGTADVDFRSGRDSPDAGSSDGHASLRDVMAEFDATRDGDRAPDAGDSGSHDAPVEVPDVDRAEADAESSVSVSICPSTTTLLAGERMAFHAEVAGTLDRIVQWAVVGDGGVITAGGVYTAPSTPGHYQVQAVSHADHSKSQTASITVLAPTAVPTLSGKVEYAGSATGRVYVTAEDDQGGTTTIPAPGPFMIRGIFGGARSIKVRAYMDTLGVGLYVAAADPVDEQTVNWTGEALSGVRFALMDPPADPFDVPGGVTVDSHDRGALVRWKPLRDAQGRELVDHYRIFASPEPDPGADPAAIVTNVRAGTLPMAFVESLANATAYYFAVTGVRDGIEGSDAIEGPVVIGASIHGVDVSGTVSVPEWLSHATGRPYVLLSGATSAYVARLDPTAAKPFTIHGVAPGSYDLAAVFDRNANGELGPSDPATLREPTHPPVTVANADMGGLQISLPVDESFIRTTTEHRVDDAGIAYATDVEVGNVGGRRLVVKAALTSGPGISPPIDMRMDDAGRFHWHIAHGSQPPGPGTSYDLNLTYDDGTTCSATASGATFLAVPAPTKPVGAGAGSARPTFQWDAPSPAPGWFTYELDLRVAGGSDIWQYDLPSSFTGTVFNADDSATVGALSSSSSYTWTLSVCDASGNRATHETSFTVP